VWKQVIFVIAVHLGSYHLTQSKIDPRPQKTVNALFLRFFAFISSVFVGLSLLFLFLELVSFLLTFSFSVLFPFAVIQRLLFHFGCDSQLLAGILIWTSMDESSCEIKSRLVMKA
jgi:hypothetical protein